MQLRNEWKHEIAYADLLALRTRLSAVMQTDVHAIDGKYRVRSLYFDNLYDKALLEKINGVNRREKFRLRYYNDNTDYIVLEKKSKINGLCAKEQAMITKETARDLLEQNTEKMINHRETLVRELAYKMKTEGLQPKTLVDYTREPFVFPAGNVRVTLDYNIRTGLRGIDFLNPDCMMIPAGDMPVILEVKWDTFLPAVIRDAVQTAGTHTTAFSKYKACRMYG